MEYEIQKHNIQIPPRPSTQSVADLAAIRKSHGTQLEEYETEIMPQMRDEAKVRDGDPKAKHVAFNNFVLERRGPHDWRDSKNSTRDYPRMAIIAFIEPRLVKAYRKQLLEKSPAAAWIRGELQCVLSRYAKSRQVLKPGAQKFITVRRYNFPDGIKIPRTEIPDVDVPQILSQLADARNVAEDIDSLRATIKKLESLPFAVARPDVSILAQNVKSSIDGFYKVPSTISCFYLTQIKSHRH
jgi:hypothetical protein